jgi:hypothetical protein
MSYDEEQTYHLVQDSEYHCGDPTSVNNKSELYVYGFQDAATLTRAVAVLAKDPSRSIGMWRAAAGSGGSWLVNVSCSFGRTDDLRSKLNAAPVSPTHLCS